MSNKQHDSAFAASVSQKLTEAGISKAQFAEMIGKSPAFVSQLTNTSKYRPSPFWVNRVADILDLSPEERFELHMDACVDRGFFQ